MTAAIELSAVGKRYYQMHDQPMLVNHLLSPRRRRREELWALQDVNLTCERGETVGVIGRNGSGKTTLLRLIAGVSAPTVGRVVIRGRVAPLIGVGVGFDPELTGIENVFFNGRLLGLDRETLAARLDSIVAFSELGSFVETAVKYYSTGMFMRLAFAVAAHTEPEVLLVDEVLAVGDLAFQAKCIDRMRELQRAGTTIVVVTHNLDTVYRMCNRAVVMDHGVIAFDGDPEGGIARYHGMLSEAEARNHVEDLLLQDADHRPVVGGASVDIEIVDADGATTQRVATGDGFDIRMTARFDRAVEDPLFGFSVAQPGRGLLHVTYTASGDYRGTHDPQRPLDATFSLRNHLLPGNYTVQTAVLDRSGQTILGSSPPARLIVTSLSRTVGLVDLETVITVGGRPIRVSDHVRIGGIGDN
jgi:ABC-type polysaccharide/polyol phosphate transport system ATPase subunit